MRQKRFDARRSVAYTALALAGMVAGVPAASAVELSEPGSDVKVTWDNTLRYRLAYRTTGQDSALLGQPNNDDGDRNFNRGIVASRMELLSELDVVSRSGFGLRVSGQGWYDPIYSGNNDNPGFAGGAVPNRPFGEHNTFNRTTRRMQGDDFQIRDAFVMGKLAVADMPATVRFGRHAQVWGESLFFASNAIAGAQSPFDIGRLLTDPTAQAKEFVLPVPQVSGQIQINPNVSVGAYYQFKWTRNNFPPVGSYFSQGDIFGQGAENMWVGPGQSVPSLGDMRAKNSGQGGLQLRWNAFDTDFGAYVLRFHDKSPQIVTRLGQNFQPIGFYQAFHEGTTAYGLSASRTFGEANVAVEASLRQNQALSSSGGASDFGNANNSGRPAYATGKTAHVNASVIWALEPGALWREATFVGEVAWNRMLSCKENCSNPFGPAALDPNGTRDAYGLRMVFTPTYRQVVSGLDLSVPVGLGYSPRGSRSLALGPGYLPPENGGDMTIGIAGVYQSAWFLNLSYTHFYGAAKTLLTTPQAPGEVPLYNYGQSYKDRDFITLTVRRTF